MHFALFATGTVWMLASAVAAGKSAQGIAVRFDWLVLQPILRQSFFLFLLLLGFTALNWISTRMGSMRETNGLPARETAGREFGIGAALGWAMAIATVLPMLLVRTLHPVFWFAPRAWWLTVLSLATLAVATLALEVAFRGYLFRQLIGAFGTGVATVLISAAYTLAITLLSDYISRGALLTTFVLALVFAAAYLRTHALWLGWGLHFAWAAVIAMLFGLPTAGKGAYSTIVTSYTSGWDALTGGDFGPDASLWVLLVALAILPLLYRITRDYAWAYTHAPIVPGGYPMEAQPPAAHVAMQNSVAPPPPAPLVQILGTTPTASSTMPVIDEHLRRNNAPSSTDDPES